MSEAPDNCREWYFSPKAKATLNRDFRRLAGKLERRDSTRGDGAIVAFVSEILAHELNLPFRVRRPTTSYLLLKDVPLQAMLQVPATLHLNRKNRRLHVTADHGCVRRAVAAQYRRQPWEGIIDAYVLPPHLAVLAGDLTMHSFPIQQIRALDGLDQTRLESFEIDPDGSFLHWYSQDLHLGVSEMLKQTDRDYLGKLEMERFQKDQTDRVVASMRERRGILQREIAGLSELEVQGIESGASHLTIDSANKLAGAFGQTLEQFLEELSGLLGTVARDREDTDHSSASQSVA